MDIDLKGISVHIGSEPIDHNVEIAGKRWDNLESLDIAINTFPCDMRARLTMFIDEPFQFKARFIPTEGLPSEGLPIEARIGPMPHLKLAGKELRFTDLRLSADASHVTELSFSARFTDDMPPAYTRISGYLLDIEPLAEYTMGAVDIDR